MPRLSNTERATLGRLNAASRDATSAPALAARALALLRPTLHFDEAAILAVDDRSLLFTRLLAYSGSTFDRLVEWLRDMYLVGEPMEIDGVWFPTLLAHYGGALVLHERMDRWLGVQPPADRRQAWEDFWQSTGSPPGGGVWFGFAERGRWVAALIAARWEPGDGFERHDLELLRRLGPGLARAISALLRPRSLEPEPGRGVPERGNLVFGADRRIALIDAAGEAWIDRIPEDGLKRHGLPVPVAVQSVVNYVARTAMATSLRLTDRDGNGVEVRGDVIREPRVGGLGHEDHGLANWIHVSIGYLAIEGRLAAHRITPRQRVVAAAVAQGFADRAIASSLEISVPTVRQHVRALHQAFGTRTRPQLVAALSARPPER